MSPFLTADALDGMIDRMSDDRRNLEEATVLLEEFVRLKGIHERGCEASDGCSLCTLLDRAVLFLS